MFHLYEIKLSIQKPVKLETSCTVILPLGDCSQLRVSCLMWQSQY